MNIIKGLDKIKWMMTDADLQKLEAGALLYQKHSRIGFKVIRSDGGILTIQTVQDKSPADNYLTQAELIRMTKDLFTPFFKDYQINVHAKPFEPSPPDNVDLNYIKAMMLDHGINLKRLVKMTGIDKSSLSLILNDKTGLSQGMKAMFYYLFEWYALTPDGLHQHLENVDKNPLEGLN